MAPTARPPDFITTLASALNVHTLFGDAAAPALPSTV
jgi:hypothetical protein